jgi:arabinose-5-phosphate isomerase
MTMETSMDPIGRAKAVIRAEAAAVLALEERLDRQFSEAVELLLACTGRVVTTGVGKAGAIARKLAATLASTGTPALYLHPAEGVHGDLGVVTQDDIVIALSYSGESDEVIRLLPTLNRIGPKLIAFVGNLRSSLAQAATLVLDVSVSQEACPLGLAPTTSVAAMLAMGDALAMATMEARGFTREDFATFHPAGTLGRKLTLRVSDVMRTGEQLAIVPEIALLRDAIIAIQAAGAGAVCLVDVDGKLTGLITDGDVRRAVLSDDAVLTKPANLIMSRSPFAIVGNPLAAEAMTMMEEHPRRIGDAPVVDAEGRPVGMVMIKDLVRIF